MPNANGPSSSDKGEIILARGTTLGRYTILQLVGRGGMGTVYAAYDPELDRKVAIKLLHLAGGPASVGSDARTRLIREAQAIAKLSHPNVITVYDVGTFEDRTFIAMEFIDGHTVTYWIHAEPRHWTDTLGVFVAAGRGLAAAHEKRIVHRDFKPDNVMVGSDGQIRVMDFGLARLGDGEKMPWTATVPAGATVDVSSAAAVSSDEQDLNSTRVLHSPTPPKPEGVVLSSQSVPLGDNLTRTGTMLGTPAYMAPEQFQGLETDARTDQFSFCVALYEALWGQRPFAGDTLFGLSANVVQGMIRPLPEQSPVPAWLCKAVLRGLSAAPADRWPSMEVLLTELAQNRSGPEPGQFATVALSKLAGLWEPPAPGQRTDSPEKERTREAFLATGKVYAATSFANASRVLDQYAQSWVEMYADACEATHIRREQSEEVLDLRMAFLQEARESLRALCTIFREATGDVVENALSAANALPRIERCADIEVLRAVVKPPADPDVRAAVDAGRTRLAQLRTLFTVGRLSDTHKGLAALEAETRRIGYGPLLAEVLLLRGSVGFNRGEADASAKALEESVWTAELSHHDEVVAEAATQLVGAGAYGMIRPLTEVWARHAEMTLRRIGGHEQLWGWYFNNLAGACHRYGDLKGAIENVLRAIATKEKVFGPDDPDTVRSIGNYALYLAESGDLEGAIVHSQRSLRILESRVGPEHPDVALGKYNYSEYLNQLGRFTEAREVAQQALAVYERELEPNNLLAVLTRLALGISYLGEGAIEQAVPIIEGAVNWLESNSDELARIAEAHFALARAVAASTGDPVRARELAERARKEYAQAPTSTLNDRALVQIDAFLASHAPG